MARLKIKDAPLLPVINGDEKIPTGGKGDFTISPDQISLYLENNKGFVLNPQVKAVEKKIDGHKADTSNPHSTTKEQVGLGNVDNTSDIDKPVSNATSIVLDSKADKEKTYTKTETENLISPISQSVQALNDAGGLKQYDRRYGFNSAYAAEIGGYPLNAELRLANGDIVRSTIASNVNNPNENMTGWVKTNSAGQIFNASGKSQQEINDFGGAGWWNKPSGYKSGATVKLDNGDIVKSTVSNNTVDPNSDMTGWEGTGLKQPLNVLSKSISRALYDHVIDYVNAKDYGAIADGTLHTVQEWVDAGKFSGLPSIQLAFPHVTALTDSIDWAALQMCANMRKNIYAPSGTYFTEKSVDTPHSGSPNRVDTNICIFGDGIKTIFTRNAANQPATRILDVNGEDDVTAFDDIINAEAFFSVHGCYYKFTDCMFQNNRVGIYFGQDLRNLAEKSVCYFNAVRDVVFRKNGTGIVMSSSGGNHYNNFQNIHFIEGQIDFEMIKGKYDITGIANNNRNYFNNIRSNRSKVGLWCKSGDTNIFNAWHGENCGANPVNNVYPAVTGLPKLLSGVQITNAVHILDKLGQLNTISSSKMEACEIELFNNQVYSSFSSNRYHESTENGTQVYNLKEVGNWKSAETMVTPYFAYLSNANINAFPTIPTAGFSFRGAAPIRNNTGRVITKRTVVSNSYSEKRLYELSSATASELKTVSIWGDVDSSSSANIKVRVSALSSVSNLSFLNEFVVCANRSSTRTLSRYFLSEISKLRASGQGVGDSATVIVPTVIHGGSSTRELILNLQMPAYAMDSILVEVEMMVNKV